MNKINLNGTVGWEIDHILFSEEIDAMTGDIEFDMGSGGGFITPGVTIVNKIRDYDRGETIAKISHASSMMTLIALACDKVKVYDNAIFMIHNAQNIEMGDHHAMRAMANHLEKMSDMLSQLYVKKTGKSLAEIKDMMSKTTYMFGKEIVEEGFADEVIDTDGKKDKNEAIELSKLFVEKATSAMKQEKLTSEDMERNFKMCKGNCSINKKEMGSTTSTAMPVKLAKNKTQGVIMEMTAEEIDAMQSLNATLLANKGTLETRVKTANIRLEDKEAELSALTANFDEKLSKSTAVAQTDASATAVASATAIVAQAFETGVATQATITAMLQAGTPKAAATVALAAQPSSQAIGQQENNLDAGTESSWAGIEFNSKD